MMRRGARRASRRTSRRTVRRVLVGGMAKGGSVSLYVDGQKDGEGRVAMTVPMLFGTDTCDVGKDAGSTRVAMRTGTGQGTRPAIPDQIP